MSLKTQSAAADSIRLVTSKDRQRTIAVQMDDALHARTWGRLYVAVPVGKGPVEVLSRSDAAAWIERERAVGQISTKERLAALRATKTDWLSVAGDIAGFR